MIKIISPKSIKEMRNPHGVSFKRLYENEFTQVTQIKLLPGEEIRKHITAVDVFFYILEGKGIVEIGDDRGEVFAEMLVESPANLPHRLFNESNKPFRFLVVKTLRQRKDFD